MIWNILSLRAFCIVVSDFAYLLPFSNNFPLKFLKNTHSGFTLIHIPNNSACSIDVGLWLKLLKVIKREYTSRAHSLVRDFLLGYFWSRVKRSSFHWPIFIHPSSDGTYYGMVMSVRPSIRVSLRVSVCQSQFSTFFSYMICHIELKFYMSLSSYEHLIKFEFRQFPSIFVGVMPLLELKTLEIHSFPQFSPMRAWGVKSRMCPPYPQRDRKRRLNGAVCRNHRIKRVVPCRC